MRAKDGLNCHFLRVCSMSWDMVGLTLSIILVTNFRDSLAFYCFYGVPYLLQLEDIVVGLQSCQPDEREQEEIQVKEEVKVTEEVLMEEEVLRLKRWWRGRR